MTKKKQKNNKLTKQIKDLQKALSAGDADGDLEAKEKLYGILRRFGLKSIPDAWWPFGGGPLKVESLEAVMKVVTYNFGTPDKLAVDSKTLADYQKLLK